MQIEVVDSAGKVMESDDEIVIERLWDDGAPANVTRGSLNKGRALYTFTPDISHARSNLNLLVSLPSKYNDGDVCILKVLVKQYL